MISIRRNTFETNSSSTHSISFCSSMDTHSNDLVVSDYDNRVLVSLGEFGWEIKDYDSTYDKLSYLLTYVCQENGLSSWCDDFSDEEVDLIIENIYELPDFKEIESCVMSNVDCRGIKITDIEGYIDHQSIYGSTLQEYLSYVGVDSIQTYLFGNVILHTDNDNH